MGKQGKTDDQISDSILERAREEEKYYNNLYDFAIAVSRANEMSFNGANPYKIANILRKLLESFYSLCLYDPEIIKKGMEKHTEEVAKKVEKEVDKIEDKEIVLMGKGNMLEINEEGWGLCPMCSSKILKVTSVTRLENFPVYCKRCKADHVVNWWNAKKLRIEYKRYVNDNAIIENAFKGTGLKSFRYTGYSATERAAMRR